MTGTGLTDFVMERTGSATAETVSDAVIPLTQVPDTVTTFVISASSCSGAYAFSRVSYTIVALPPAGTFTPVIVSGGPASTVGAVWSTPF